MTVANPPRRADRWLLPTGVSADAGILLRARGIRAFGDGFVSVLLPLHLTTLGFSAVEVGAVATATLLGSAALTLVVGFVAYRLGRRLLLLRASLLMIATGVGFAFVHAFWPLLVVAFVGTLNPSAGDVSVFLPTEQALLPQTTPDAQRTALFARYSLIGSLVAAVGALAAALPQALSDRFGWPLARGFDAMFLLYALLGLAALLLYRGLSPRIEPAAQARAPLTTSRPVVLKLAALFSLDSFGGGFVVQSLLAFWLFQRFGFSAATAGAIFFWTGVLAAFSALAAARIARRIGLLNTAVFTHLPANVFLIATPFMPTSPLAVACLLARSALSQMDVPVRNSYVMAVVSPAERPAAASVTSVPRSLAAATSPLLAGWLFGLSPFGWPLVLGGALKGLYDVLLLLTFRRLRPPEEGG
ncbi:MAG TPA: MFS transporter [Thermomicrobiales bacterium]|nr:MFS transporter [Thermomicrobiales bacterium]